MGQITFLSRPVNLCILQPGPLTDWGIAFTPGVMQNMEGTPPPFHGPAFDKPYSEFRLVCSHKGDKMHGYKYLHRTVE